MSASNSSAVLARARTWTGSRSVPAWSLLAPFVTAVLLAVVMSQAPDGRLHVWVIDVGQGDGILLRTPAGHTALIDGGPAATPLLNAVGSHIPFWEHTIDLVVLTHPHDDHLMGLVDAVKRYGVGQVAQTEFTSTQGVQAEWLQTLQARSIPVYYAKRGDTISFEGEPDLSFSVLSPVTPDARQEQKSGGLNNTSLVLRLNYGKEAMILEGDAQMQAEETMVAQEGPELAAQVLKVGHHGSNTSSTPKFLEAVRPRLALISVGVGNAFGHPATRTIESLAGVGASVLRTDERGTIEIIADKDKIWVRGER